MGISIAQLLIILIVILILFGAGKLPEVMGEMGRGLKSFKKNLDDDSTKTPVPPAKKKSDKAVKKLQAKK
jgi:sec-independent protein translocase protein TatA